MARWERLALRLAAAVAWKKTKLLLAWLSTSLQFSEGCSERLGWLGDGVVEHADPTDPTGAPRQFVVCCFRGC